MSKVAGVRFIERKGWGSTISLRGSPFFLGLFKTEEEAVAARRAGEKIKEYLETISYNYKSGKR